MIKISTTKLIERPHLLQLLFLIAFCPLLGESYRLPNLPLATFIFVVSIYCIANIGRCRVFLKDFSSLRYYLASLVVFLLGISVIALKTNSKYWILIVLVPFYFFCTGLYLGWAYSELVNIKALFHIFLTIMLIVAIKKIAIIYFQIQPTWDGLSFFSGIKSDLLYGIPRIILKGETPFLVAAFFVNAAYLYKNAEFTWIKLVSIILFILLIMTNRTRSLCIGICISFVICIYCSVQLKYIRSFRSISMLLIFIFLIVLLGLFVLPPGVQHQVIGIGYRVNEMMSVFKAVDGSIIFGLLPGAGYYYAGSDVGIGVQDNYVHFLPVWLYLKGGLVFLMLFYIFMIKIVGHKIKFIDEYALSLSPILVVLGIFLGLIFTDVMTNQFASISGSFFLGFFGLYRPRLS
jgi:hypothetical protein